MPIMYDSLLNDDFTEETTEDWSDLYDESQTNKIKRT